MADKKEIEVLCGYCGKRPGVKKCEKCGTVSYCSDRCEFKNMRTHTLQCSYHRGMKKEKELLDSFFSWVLTLPTLKEQALSFSRKGFLASGEKGIVMLAFKTPDKMKRTMGKVVTSAVTSSSPEGQLTFEYFSLEESEEKVFVATESLGVGETWSQYRNYDPSFQVFFGVLLGEGSKALTNLCVF